MTSSPRRRVGGGAATDAASTPLAGAARAGDPSALDRTRLLLVEDDSINQQIAGEILRRAGATVDITSNGREAVEMVTASYPGAPYHAVLMDLQMPEMDGYDATRAIRADPASTDLPIIAMTAQAMVEERRHCLDVGMNDHVAKPVDPDRLVGTLVRWLAPAHASGTPRQQGPEPAPEHRSREHTRGARARTRSESPGLDFEQGISRLEGNADLYREVVREFVEREGDFAGRLGSALENRDLAGAAHLAHALKGLAGNLSANSLHHAAGRLESALNREQPPEDLVVELERRLDEAIASAQTWLGSVLQSEPTPNGVGSSAQRPASGPEFEKRCQALASLIETQNLASEHHWREIVAGYEVQSATEEAGELGAGLAKLDFPRARRALGALRRKLASEAE